MSKTRKISWLGKAKKQSKRKLYSPQGSHAHQKNLNTEESFSRKLKDYLSENPKDQLTFQTLPFTG